MNQQVASLSNQQYGKYTTLLNYVSVFFWLPALHFNGLSCLVTFSRTMVSLHLTRKKHTRSLALARSQHLRWKKHQYDTKRWMCLGKRSTFVVLAHILSTYGKHTSGRQRFTTKSYRILHPFASILAMPKQTRAKVSFNTQKVGLGTCRYVWLCIYQ